MLSFVGTSAFAQVSMPSVPTIQAPEVPSAPSAQDMLELKAGTTLLIETTVSLSSKSAKPGDRFTIALASPLTADGRAVIVAGIRGEGEIIHAAKARWGGKAGELIANARFLDCGGVRLLVGRLHWSMGGANKVGEALAFGMLFTPAMFLINGGEVEIPAHTSGAVKLSSDVSISRAQAETCRSAQPVTNP